MSSILTARLVGGYTEQGSKCSQAYNAVVLDVVFSVIGLLTKPNSKLCMAKQSKIIGTFIYSVSLVIVMIQHLQHYTTHIKQRVATCENTYSITLMRI